MEKEGLATMKTCFFFFFLPLSFLKGLLDSAVGGHWLFMEKITSFLSDSEILSLESSFTCSNTSYCKSLELPQNTCDEVVSASASLIIALFSYNTQTVLSLSSVFQVSVVLIFCEMKILQNGHKNTSMFTSSLKNARKLQVSFHENSWGKKFKEDLCITWAIQLCCSLTLNRLLPRCGK